MSRPNILYIHSHDTGRYIQPYGYAVPTPRMQKLAEEGVLFRQAFCAAPTCSPSRAALLTGMAPHNNGMLGLAHRGFGLNDYKQHLVHTLKQAGYHTCLSGTQHEAHDAALIGYDEVHREKGVPPEEGALQFLNNAPKQPFFLAAGWGLTHRNGAGDGKEPGFNQLESPLGDPRYVTPPTTLPDTPQTRQDMADYCVAANRLDTAYGKVFDALEANGLAENTIVICTTDHGVPFPHNKCNLTDHGLGVLLIIRGPHGFTGGKVIDGMVSHIDIFPTLCEQLEINTPDWVQGKSVMPLVRDETDQVNDEIYGEITFHAAYEPQRAVRTSRYKYIRRFDGRSKPVRSNVDRSPSRYLWEGQDWENQPVVEERLYDLIFDPTEGNNLVGQPHASEILNDMRSRLESWMKRTDDPLLNGSVPAPEGSRIDDSDWYAPGMPSRKTVE